MAPRNPNGGGPWGPGPSGGPRKQPDLEQLLKRGQDKFKQVMPGGSGLPGSLMFLVVVVSAKIIVLRFGRTRASRFLPYIGSSVFLLLLGSWATSSLFFLR